MDWVVYTAILLGLLLAVGMFFVENALGRLLNPLLSLVGLNSSTGPLSCHATQKGKSIEIVIDNNGNTKAGIVAISVADSRGKTLYPIPFSSEGEAAGGTVEAIEKDIRRQLIAHKINPGTSKTVYLSQQEVEGCNLNSLQVMDIHGTSWSVSHSG